MAYQESNQIEDYRPKLRATGLAESANDSRGYIMDKIRSAIFAAINEDPKNILNMHVIAYTKAGSMMHYGLPSVDSYNGAPRTVEFRSLNGSSSAHNVAGTYYDLALIFWAAGGVRNFYVWTTMPGGSGWSGSWSDASGNTDLTKVELYY